MSSEICAGSDKENHVVPHGIAAIGEDAERAQKLMEISNQWTERSREKCEHAEQLGRIGGVETKRKTQSEEKSRIKRDGDEIWTDILLNDPYEELDAIDRASWLVVEKRKFICRSMSPDPYPRRRPQKENGNKNHDEKK